MKGLSVGALVKFPVDSSSCCHCNQCLRNHVLKQLYGSQLYLILSDCKCKRIHKKYFTMLATVKCYLRHNYSDHIITFIHAVNAQDGHGGLLEELSISQCLEKAPTRASSLMKAPTNY